MTGRRRAGSPGRIVVDPQSEPYRPSWLPFGPSRRSEMTGGTSGVRLRASTRARIPMAPVQLGRPAMQSPPVAPIRVSFASPSAAPATRARPPQAPTTRLRPAALPAPGPPRRPGPTGARRPPPPITPRYAQPQVAPSSGPGQEYPPPLLPSPTILPRAYSPGYRPAGAPRARNRQRIDRSRVPRPATAASSTPASSGVAGRARGAGVVRGAVATFDPMAIVAIILTFVVPPFALVVAIASVRRAYRTGVSPALSWLSVLVAGVGTLLTFGILSSITSVFSGLG